MSSFLPPRYRALDNEGTPLVGAKLYFYKQGLPEEYETIYAEPLLQTPLANPVESDSDGYFPAIYLKKDVGYFVELRLEDETLVWNNDEIYGVAFSAGLVTRLKQVASNPLDYGALGDGLSDEAEYVQAAIDAASGTVDLLGLTYRCDSMLTLRSGIRLTNGTLDFSACADESYLFAHGDAGEPITVTSAVIAGSRTVSLQSVDDLSVGDYLLLSAVTLHHSLARVGEIVQIQQIDGLDVTTSRAINGGYSTSPTATRLEMVKDVILDNVRIVGDPTSGDNVNHLDADCCTRLTVTRCTLDGIANKGVSVGRSTDAVVSGCQFLRGGESAEGVKVESASSEVAVVGGSFAALAVGVSIGRYGDNWGVVRQVSVDGCTFGGCSSTAVYVGDMAEHTRIAGIASQADGTADGIYVGYSDDVRVYGCSLRGGQWGIIVDALATNFSQLGNYFTGQSSGTVDGAGTSVLTLTGTGGQSGLTSTGSGTGKGVLGVGGNTSGTGVAGIGGTNGVGVAGAGTGTGTGVFGVGGNSNGDGVLGQGAGSGDGVVGTGGETAGAGLRGVGGVNGVGAYGAGGGTAEGVYGVGGSTSGTGVHGVGGEDDGHGLHGEASGDGDGVYGEAEGAGSGVRGENSSSGAAIKAVNSGTGRGVNASSVNEAAVYGEASGYGAGVHGKSATGPGGKFEGNGDRAPICIGGSPGAPTYGFLGDIYFNTTDAKLYVHNGVQWMALN